MNRTIKMVALILVMATLLSSCTLSGGMEYVSTDGELKKLAEAVLDCLDNDDFETLKGFFSEYISSQDGFDEQLREVMDVYEGKSISHDPFKNRGADGASWRNGQKTWHRCSAMLNNIETDAGKKYSFRCSTYLVSAVEPDKEGIYMLTIFEGDSVFGGGKEYAAGEMIEAESDWD